MTSSYLKTMILLIEMFICKIIFSFIFFPEKKIKYKLIKKIEV